MMFDIKQPFQSFDYCLREMKKKGNQQMLKGG
jgi:hypothetical protein